MTRLTTLCMLLVVLVQQQTVVAQKIINTGGEYRRDCPISVSNDPDRYIIQFFVEKTEVKMFNSRTFIDTLRLVSNGTTIVPAITNNTDRYSVEENNGRYLLIIKNVTETDSAWYGCRSFDLERNESRSSTSFSELLVPGPFDGVFWTANYSRLSLDIARQHEIPDGGIILTDNAWYGPNIACAVLVSNKEPAVNITIGRFGKPGSVDITNQFDTRASSVTSHSDVGMRYRATVFFVKQFKFKKSLRDVFCRASLFGKTYERSVSIQVTSKPKNTRCNPVHFAAVVGDKNVNLTCLIEAHPEPYVEWVLRGNRYINVDSNNPDYTVTNVAQFEGLLTTLTFSELTDEIYEFGEILIKATNSEGRGTYHLFFRPGEVVAAAGITRSSATLITMTTGLLVWMLK